MHDAQKETMTIVVPVKNRPHLVSRTLDSIKAQTWRPMRVVVVDNDSTDETPDVLRQWKAKNETPDFQVDIFEEKTPGPAAARARGVEEVDSRLVMHFDSDDIMEPHHVETVMQRFAADDYPDLVYFRIRQNSIDGKKSMISHSPGSDGIIDSHLKHSILSTPRFACETALIRRAGSWNRKLVCWEDFELGLRILLEARRRAFIKDVEIEIYSREESVTGTEFFSKRGKWEEALREMEKTLEKSTHPKRRKWMRYISYRKAILAAAYRKEGHPEEAKVLLKEALANPLLNALQRSYFRVAYQYTALGGRGAYIPGRFIL